ncbi:MAG: SycD/LcrH family type III secretion system chaperone [Chlamydiales bacterium]|nr:SycD/LcrH family type III secretion system chaperone [Chlamydiia bacterium]MCP5508344.1 SycD/LcrH family type III secretion system chaperone [Chlamydiales bacterium]
MYDHMENFHLSEKAKSRLEDKEWLKKQLAKGKSAQKILEITDRSMKSFYEAAQRLYDHQFYTDAANAFLFLVTLNPYNHDYWLGLGKSTQMTSDFEAAIDAYEIAMHLNVDSPVPYFYLAKCFFAMHDPENALTALDLALEYAGDNKEYADLKIQAMAARELLKKDRAH